MFGWMRRAEIFASSTNMRTNSGASESRGRIRLTTNVRSNPSGPSPVAQKTSAIPPLPIFSVRRYFMFSFEPPGDGTTPRRFLARPPLPCKARTPPSSGDGPHPRDPAENAHFFEPSAVTGFRLRATAGRALASRGAEAGSVEPVARPMTGPSRALKLLALAGGVLGVDPGPAHLLLGLALELDRLSVGREHGVSLGDHLARGVLELLVDDEAIGRREAADRVDRERPGDHELIARLGHQRLRLARVPVLERVIGDEQGMIELGRGRVAEEEVGLVAGPTPALDLVCGLLGSVLGRRRGPRALPALARLL